MKTPKFRYFVGDFETTVYEGQTDTEVWASASVELYSDNVSVFNSIEQQFNYFIALNCNIICYYHNLKFDGNFWLSYLLTKLHYKQAYETGATETDIKWLADKDMPNKSFKYLISEMGQWYNITVKVNDKVICFRDSFKLLPFAVKRIGESFQTKHKKLEIEYEGKRKAGGIITPEEQEYIKNDVLVVKEAMEIMFSEGHNKMTIGSCCLAEYKKTLSKYEYDDNFPNLYDIEISEECFGNKTAGDYIKKAYRGGWCYLVKGKENQLKHNGTTADVNSLYPSMMSSESGNYYPIGKPHFWNGNFIPEIAQRKGMYYFVRLKTRFYLKDGKLPFIQIKHNLLYNGNESLTTSDVYDPLTGKYYDKIIGFDGSIKDTAVTLTLTMTDYELIKEHYDLIDCEILDGCYFRAKIGIYDDYINKYKKIKMESKGAKRELAKLFLNNLYGKMASSTCSSFKIAYIKEDNSIGFYTIEAHDKAPGYIACGAAITSYARNFTIRAAQKNFHGVNERGFIYADTDSIHCDLSEDEITGIKVDDKEFCCWKLESFWDEAIFTRQKTYIEHITHENRKPISNAYYNVKCAGMPDRCKQLFMASMGAPINEKEKQKLSEDEKEFLKTKRDLTDFKIGLKIPGKLLPKRIPGGVLLVNTTYEMR